MVCAETPVESSAVGGAGDARGIAQMVRVDMIRPVHVKTVSSAQADAVERKFMLKRCDAESDIRGRCALRTEGGEDNSRRFEARARPGCRACLVEPMLRARAELLTAFKQLHKMAMAAIRPAAVAVPGAR